MYKYFAAFLLVFGTMQVFAQTVSKEENLKKLIGLSSGALTSMKINERIIDAYRKQYPQVDSAFWSARSAEIKLDELFDQMVPLYAKFYTEQETQQLIDFYQTALGKKMLSVMPQLLTESMAIGQQWSAQIGKRIQEQLVEHGYVK